MKKLQFVKMIMAIAFCVLLVSCSSGGDDGGGNGCNCSGQPIIEKNGLVITLEHQTETKPANISVLFKVETEQGEPVLNITSDNVQIFEDDSPISDFESQKAILPKPGKFTSHTLLLLDLSGSVLESESLANLKEAAESFVTEMMPYFHEENYGEMDMGIWWFDGAANIHQLVPFVTDINQLVSGIESITSDISNDSSTNLYGATIEAINKIKDMVGKEQNMVSVGSVVIFTDGKDQAAWKTEIEATDAVNNADENISFYTIGLGGEIDESVLRALGKDGFVFATYIEDLIPRFQEIADRIKTDV